MATSLCSREFFYEVLDKLPACFCIQIFIYKFRFIAEIKYRKAPFSGFLYLTYSHFMDTSGDQQNFFCLSFLIIFSQLQYIDVEITPYDMIRIIKTPEHVQGPYCPYGIFEYRETAPNLSAKF